MKVLLILLISSFVCCSSKEGKPIHDCGEFMIEIGVGFPEIRIGDKPPNGKLRFNGLEFEERKGKSMLCGEENVYRAFWKKFVDRNSGLTFEFKSEPFLEEAFLPKKKMYLKEIELAKEGCLLNGFRIGHTTYYEIVEEYGPISENWKNETYLRFDSRGVAFRFDKNSIMSKIYVFAPTNK